ncbi:MAG: DNRLRE domain-containing protein, partial [Geodermatophilaceae bacterium]|nr:DNRLRE domain-containing protein [Geodermatophilaceae bacterium]
MAQVHLTISPVDDSYVAEQEQDRNHDTARLFASSIPGEAKVTYLKFDVPELPEGASEPSARLVLTRDRRHLPDSVELSAVASSQWSEQTLTMSNAPALGPQLARATPTWETTEITFALPAGVITTAGPHSVAVTSAATDDVAWFRSRESAAGGPQLLLSYGLEAGRSPLPRSPASPPPAGTPAGMWVGAAANDGSGIAGNDVFNESNAAIGPLRFRRSFDSGLPSSFQSSAAKDDAANGYRSFVSWKPPNGDFVGAAQGKYDPQVIA